MLKCLMILAIAAVAAVAVSAQSDKTASHDKQDPKKKSPSTVVFQNNYYEPPTQAQKANPSPPNWYEPLEKPEWWLVAIAALTGGAICWQSIETKRAARAAEKAARASLLQADHMTASERAWMIAKIDKPVIPSGGPYLPACTPELANKGKTPAFVFEIGNAVAVLDSGESLPEQHGGYEEGNIFRRSDDGIPVAPEGVAGRPIIADVAENSVDILAGKRVIWVHGYVKYLDISRSEERETRYCFRFVPCTVSGSSDHNFVVDGPDAYNRAT